MDTLSELLSDWLLDLSLEAFRWLASEICASEICGQEESLPLCASLAPAASANSPANTGSVPF